MNSVITEGTKVVGEFLRILPPARILIADSLFLFAYFLVANFFRRYVAVYMAFIAPGTLLHELMHWVVALITNGKPNLPSIWPKRTRDGWMLGHVDFSNPRWYNTALIALAPLLLLPLVIWIYLHQIAKIPLPDFWHWLFLYVAITATMSTLPSRVDLLLAWKYSATSVWVALCSVIIYLAARLFLK